MKISVFINTLNEEKRIRACLESVKWADEIIIVDMHSDDATVNICREYTSKIYLFDRIGYCEPARKFAVDQTTGDWVLNLDADELVTLGLKKELLNIVQENKFDAVYIPRKNFFWGEEMKHSGCGLMQDRPLRFYRKGAVVFSDIIHAGIQLVSSARVLRIDNPDAHMVHFSYLSIEQFWDKLQRYTTIEAKALYESGKEYSVKQVRKDVWDAFWKRYIKKSQGYKDGQWGFIYCIWTAVYKLNIYAKYLLMKKYQTVEYAVSVEEAYQKMSNQIISEINHEKNNRN